MAPADKEIARLQAAIEILESQRAVLGDAAVDAGVAALRQQLATLQAQRSPGLQAERRQLVTVLFCDIVGFTRFSEERDPEEVAQLASRFYEVVAETIVTFGGTVARYIGDAVMAVFGLERTAEDDAERAVRAGLALPGRLQEAGLPFHLRTGVHTGLVLSGTLAVAGRRDWTVLGDTVNVTSRLQGAAPKGGLLISRTTFQHIRGIFDLQPRPPLAVKGKAEPLQTYQVLRGKDYPFHPLTRGVEGLVIRTVGREKESAYLQDLFVQALEKKCVLVTTVVGDPGLGKSRLVADLEEWLDLRSEDIWCFRMQARPSFQQQGQSQPYALLRAMWFERFALTENAPAREAEGIFEAGIRSLWPEAPEDCAPVLGHLVGLPFEDSPALRGLRQDAATLRGRSIVLGRDLWQHLLQRDPIVLLLEDLHWADGASVEWLGQVIHNLSGPVLVVGASRPEWQPPDWPRQRILNLEPLSAEHGRQLVQELLKQVPNIPPELETMISERIEGVPYYAEEIVNWLLDQGVIEAGPEHWSVHLERLEGRPLPATLQHLLLSRVDTLPGPERQVLQWASVVGRVFWQGAVSTVGGIKEVVPSLRRLQEQRMVEWRPASSLAGEREWAFHHMLLRDAVYETVLRRDRPEMHRRVAHWLEEQTGERRDEYAALLAGHYEIAGESERASHFYLQATARSRYIATDAAIDYGQRALELGALDQGEDRLQLYEILSELLVRKARHEEALHIYQSLREEAEAAGDEETLILAQLGSPRVLEGQGRPQQALEEMAEPLAALSQRTLSPSTKAKVLYRAGWLHHRLGANDRARQYAEQAMELVQDTEDSLVQVYNLNLLGAIYIREGNDEQAEACLEQGLSLLRKLGHWRGIGIVLSNLGEIARTRGKYLHAESYCREALSIARRIGDRQGEIYALNNVGASLIGLGQADQAEDFLRESIALQESRDSQVLLSETYRFLAQVLLKLERLPDALGAAQRSLELGQSTGYTEHLATAWRTLAQVTAHPACSQDDWKPEECFAASLRLFEESDMQIEQARTLRAFGHYLIESGLDEEQGQTLLSQADTLLGDQAARR